jgi:hypothetical protein
VCDPLEEEARRENQNLNHRGRREAQRKTVFCHSSVLMNADFKTKTNGVFIRIRGPQALGDAAGEEQIA